MKPTLRISIMYVRTRHVSLAFAKAVHILPPYFFTIRSILILQSMSRRPELNFPSGFLTRIVIHLPEPSCVLDVSQSHPTQIAHLNDICKKTNKNKLNGLSPRANYTDRATAASRWSDCQLLRIKGATWSAWRIPAEPLLFYQVAPQLYSRCWVEPVPDHYFFFLVLPGIEPGPPDL
jgi:hypothetical protein